MSRFGALLIDLDGVLVDSHSVIDRTWRRWADLHGIEVEPVLDFLPGRKASETIRAFAPSDADIARETQRVLDWECDDTEGLIILPGARRILTQTMIPVCIVTSCHVRLAHARLEAVGLPSEVPLVSGDQVGNGKPAPDPYLVGAERLGIAIETCLVIEDAPAGIEAGRQAGATVCAVRTAVPESQLTGSHHVVNDLDEVIDQILHLG